MTRASRRGCPFSLLALISSQTLKTPAHCTGNALLTRDTSENRLVSDRPTRLARRRKKSHREVARHPRCTGQYSVPPLYRIRHTLYGRVPVALKASRPLALTVPVLIVSGQAPLKSMFPATVLPLCVRVRRTVVMSGLTASDNFG